MGTGGSSSIGPRNSGAGASKTLSVQEVERRIKAIDTTIASTLVPEELANARAVLALAEDTYEQAHHDFKKSFLANQDRGEQARLAFSEAMKPIHAQLRAEVKPKEEELKQVVDEQIVWFFKRQEVTEMKEAIEVIRTPLDDERDELKGAYHDTMKQVEETRTDLRSELNEAGRMMMAAKNAVRVLEERAGKSSG